MDRAVAVLEIAENKKQGAILHKIVLFPQDWGVALGGVIMPLKVWGLGSKKPLGKNKRVDMGGL